MTEDALERIAEARARNQEQETERRLEEIANAPTTNAWRRNALTRYVAAVLERRGKERLDFMEEHPPARIFQ